MGIQCVIREVTVRGSTEGADVALTYDKIGAASERAAAAASVLSLFQTVS
jgi:hypothetical protein